MLFIVIISAAVFVIDQMDTTRTLLQLLAFHPGYIMRGEVWRLITWIFLPLNNNLIFTALMLYFYYFIGITLEREWGTPKFTLYYIFGVLLNIIYGFVLWFIFADNIGALVINIDNSLNDGIAILNSLWLNNVWIVPNYINLSMFFAFAALFPDNVIRLFFIIPIKIKWVALINAAFFAYSIISEAIMGNIATALLPIIAILNFFIVCGNDLLGYLRPLKVRTSPQTINYKKAARKAERDLKNTPYRHKCAVCGKTDVDNPAMEFRYCSRCNGYHCFCINHINDHIHFQ